MLRVQRRICGLEIVARVRVKHTIVQRRIGGLENTSH